MAACYSPPPAYAIRIASTAAAPWSHERGGPREEISVARKQAPATVAGRGYLLSTPGIPAGRKPLNGGCGDSGAGRGFAGGDVVPGGGAGRTVGGANGDGDDAGRGACAVNGATIGAFACGAAFDGAVRVFTVIFFAVFLAAARFGAAFFFLPASTRLRDACFAFNALFFDFFVLPLALLAMIAS